jgi:hypothetical protein
MGLHMKSTDAEHTGERIVGGDAGAAPAGAAPSAPAGAALPSQAVAVATAPAGLGTPIRRFRRGRWTITHSMP